jgi:prolyl oligopeptidase
MIANALTYPSSPRQDHVDVYHGVEVPDPYRWLEDPQSSATQAWIEAQNQITFDYLEQLPQRSAITKRLTQLWNYERYGTPFKRGGRYFYLKNDG